MVASQTLQGTTANAGVPAVTRADAILDLIAAHDLPMTLDEIARSLSIPKSSTLGICRTLVAHNMLFRDATGRFRIGLRTVELARAFLSRFDVVAAFEAALDVRPEPAETIQLAVLRGTEVLYLGRRDGTRPVRLASSVGSRLPATTTAVGKAMLATLEDGAIRSILGGSVFEELTPHSVRTVDELLVDLARTRERGYAIDDEETLEGVVCVAAVIPSRAAVPQGGLSATFPKPDDAGLRIGQAASLVTSLAADVSGLLLVRRP